MQCTHIAYLCVCVSVCVSPPKLCAIVGGSGGKRKFAFLENNRLIVLATIRMARVPKYSPKGENMFPSFNFKVLPHYPLEFWAGLVHSLINFLRLLNYQTDWRGGLPGAKLVACLSQVFSALALCAVRAGWFFVVGVVLGIVGFERQPSLCSLNANSPHGCNHPKVFKNCTVSPGWNLLLRNYSSSTTLSPLRAPGSHNWNCPGLEDAISHSWRSLN